MATVVNVPRDTRLDEFSLGLNSYLSGVKEARLDTLQQELMDEISKAPDEVTAAALLADRRYTKVMTVPTRAALITNYFATAQPGSRTLQGFTEGGEAVLFNIPKNEVENQETYTSRGLRFNRKDNFYVQVISDDPSKDEQIPSSIGPFSSRGEARESIIDDMGDVEFRILDQATAKFAAEFSNARASQRREEARLLLEEKRYDLAANSASTVYGKLVQDFRDGFLTKSQFDAAMLYLTERVGRTAEDVADATEKDLAIQAGAVAGLSNLGIKITDMVKADPRILTTVAGIDRVINNLVSDFDALMVSIGGRPDINAPDPEGNRFNFDSLGAISTEFKGLLFDMAISAAAARGISGKNFSDRDLQFFLTRVGEGSKDAGTFIRNMKGMVDEIQSVFMTSYQYQQKKTYDGTFKSIQLDGNTQDATDAERLLKEYGVPIPGLTVLPKTFPPT